MEKNKTNSIEDMADITSTGAAEAASLTDEEKLSDDELARVNGGFSRHYSAGRMSSEYMIEKSGKPKDAATI